MSGRRLDSTSATEDEVKDLILELQALLSNEVDKSRTNKGRKTHTLFIFTHNNMCYIAQFKPLFSYWVRCYCLIWFCLASFVIIVQVLEEICNHIKRLQREFGNLSKKICGLLGPQDTNSNVDFAEVLNLVMEL